MKKPIHCMKNRIRNFLIDIGFLLTAGLLSLGMGIVVGRHIPVPVMTFENPLFAQQDDVWADLSRGISTLANCKFFHDAQRKSWDELFKFIKGPIHLTYDPTELDIYAAAISSQRLIILAPAFFAASRRMRESIMAHEFLHLIGLPNHNYVNDKSGRPFLDTSTDLVYITTNKCFPDLPAEERVKPTILEALYVH
jgi:hypothetical protein